MKLAYFDCASGASGDMVLGALVAAGVSFEALEQGLQSLHLDEFSLSLSQVTRQGIAATQVDVNVVRHHHHDHSHGRRLGEILALIAESGLPDRVKADASRVFQALAEAEARVHGTTPEQVHFHEVGAVDSIVDVVGAALGLDLLGLGKVLVSPIRTGTGYVRCDHGRMAVPVPATVELLRDFPSVGTDLPYELTTPTGAAILTALGEPAPARPSMAGYTVGYGAGGRDNHEVANVLRLFVGESVAADGRDEVWVVETNVDDDSPEIVAYACERIFEAGAVDVFTSPIGMKKGRQGTLLRAIAPDEALEAVEAAIFLETTTLGVRRCRMERTKLSRRESTVETPFGAVRVKVAERSGQLVNAAPEYEDCRARALSAGAPLRKVYEAARLAFEGRHE